jgi:hypothetical protein
LICGIVVVIVAYELWPTTIIINGPVLGLIGLIVALALLPSISELSVPGIGTIKLNDLLREAAPAAERVEAATTAEAKETSGTPPDARDIARRLDLATFASRLSEGQPLPAMIALRADIEDRIGTVFRELYGAPPRTAPAALVRLAQDGYLDDDQVQLGLLLVRSLNMAVHDPRTSPEVANSLASLGAVFAESLTRPALTSTLAFHEQVAEVLASDERLSVQREVRAGRRIADFHVRFNDAEWLVETKAPQPEQAERLVRASVDQLVELLRWFRIKKGVLVVPDHIRLSERTVEREGDLSIAITPISELLKTLTAGGS